MAVVLRVQHGPGWIATALMALGNTRELDLLDQFTNRRNRKHVTGSARKICLQYIKQMLDKRYGSSVISSSDSSYAVYQLNQTLIRMNYVGCVDKALRDNINLPEK